MRLPELRLTVLEAVRELFAGFRLCFTLFPRVGTLLPRIDLSPTGLRHVQFIVGAARAVLYRPSNLAGSGTDFYNAHHDI